MAIASGDKTMLSLCLPGEDPHSYIWRLKLKATIIKNTLQL
jgi:hypothetical protein